MCCISGISHFRKGQKEGRIRLLTPRVFPVNPRKSPSAEFRSCLQPKTRGSDPRAPAQSSTAGAKSLVHDLEWSRPHGQPSLGLQESPSTLGNSPSVIVGIHQHHPSCDGHNNHPDGQHHLSSARHCVTCRLLISRWSKCLTPQGHSVALWDPQCPPQNWVCDSGRHRPLLVLVPGHTTERYGGEEEI